MKKSMQSQRHRAQGMLEDSAGEGFPLDGGGVEFLGLIVKV